MNTNPTSILRTPAARDLITAGFQIISTDVRYSLAVATQAPEKRGKTHWAMTAPPPIAVIASDTGTENIVQKFMREGKDIALYPYRVSPVGRSKGEYEKEYLKLERAIEAVLKFNNFRSLVVDTATEYWEMLRLARFGKLTQVMPHHYGPVNDEMKSMVKAVVDKPGLNSVWIHKLRKTYATNKEGKDAWNGNWERAGFGDMGYLVDVVAAHYLNMDTREFGITVLDSRHETTNLVGQMFEGVSCDFLSLACAAFPESDPNYWL